MCETPCLANNFKVYTFAAPSAGNLDFASYYNHPAIKRSDAAHLVLWRRC
jgi:hypothetical protein